MGVLAVWNQRAFRQTVALRYHGLLRLLRPCLSWFRPLPRPGDALRSAYVAFVSTDDVDCYRVLLSHAYERARREGHELLIAGLHEHDPRTEAFASYRSTPFAGRLFSVDFGDAPSLDGRLPHVEAALL